MTPSEVIAEHGSDAVCHLATIGRRSGRWRLIEIWFAADGDRLYLLAGGRERAHWVRNVAADPRIRVRLGGTTLAGRGRIVRAADEDERARWLVATKYGELHGDTTLSHWAATSLPVAIELAEEAGSQPPLDASSSPTRSGGQ